MLPSNCFVNGRAYGTILVMKIVSLPAPANTEITLRLRLPALSLLLLGAAAFVLPDRVWNTLLIGLGGMFVVAYGWVWFLGKGLYAQRQTESQWVAVGDRLAEHFDLWNYSPVPALWVEVIDESNVPGYQAAVVRSPGTDRVDRWRQTATCQQRGQYRLGPWGIRAGDPFGIFVITRRFPQSREIIIHPPIHVRLPINLPAGQSSGRQRARQRSLQATINAATTRPYCIGDPLRWIHWRTSARHDQLFVRQFDLDATGDIWLVLDMQAAPQLGVGLAGTEEHAVLLAASLAARALQQNRAVGVAGYGRIPQVIPPGQGQGQEWRIMRALALVQANGEADLAVALRDVGHVAEKHSTAVIITPSVDPAWLPQLLHLTRQGIESSVILLDRPSFGGVEPGRLMQEAIQMLGITAVVIHQGEVGVPPQGLPKVEFRVTPLGKVVAVSSSNLEQDE
jgi:uncharacterized protein (DUF58 family)